MQSAVGKEERKTEVTIQMAELTTELQLLRESLDTLEIRLSNVLRNVHEKNEPELKETKDFLSPLASQIRDRCDNVKACYAITQKIIDRLEN